VAGHAAGQAARQPGLLGLLAPAWCVFGKRRQVELRRDVGSTCLPQQTSRALRATLANEGAVPRAATPPGVATAASFASNGMRETEHMNRGKTHS